MRIIFIGAHGTGKTTAVNELHKHLNWPVVESVSRQCQAVARQFGWDPYGAEQDNCQLMTTEFAFWDYTRICEWGIDCIMTRSPIDVVAYMMANHDPHTDVYLNTLKEMKMKGLFDECLFFYIPIEFKLVDDGCRPMDPKYQKRVDECMRTIIDDMCLDKTKIIKIGGSVQDRVDTCLDELSINNLMKWKR